MSALSKHPRGKTNNLWGLREENTGSFWALFKCCAYISKTQKSVTVTPIRSATPVLSITIVPSAERRKSIAEDAISIKSHNSKDSGKKSVYSKQPHSSGSESSGYFTPPTETHLPLPETDKSEQFNNRYKNFGGETFEQPESFITLEEEKPQTFFIDNESVSEEGLDKIDNVSPIDLCSSASPTKRSIISFDCIDGFDLSPNKHAIISKSEADLINALAVPRKAVNSAPTLNETDFPTKITDKDDEEEKFEEQIIEIEENINVVVLPGAISDDVNVDEALVETQKIVVKTKPKTAKISKKESVSSALIPYEKPKDSFNEIYAQLESNQWEVVMKGLHGLLRLLKYHHEIIDVHMHKICVILGKHIRNLRSQVARTACSVASEIFAYCKKSVEMELDELAASLFHRTADTNKFLRSDAYDALNSMCTNLSVPKVVAVIATKGCVHQNAVVRSSATKLLCSLVHRCGYEKIFQLPRETRDKILFLGANMLTEGSLETRKQAKLLLGHLSDHCQFQKALTEAVPSKTLRHIEKTLNSLK